MTTSCSTFISISRTASSSKPVFTDENSPASQCNRMTCGGIFICRLQLSVDGLHASRSRHGTRGNHRQQHEPSYTRSWYSASAQGGPISNFTPIAREHHGDNRQTRLLHLRAKQTVRTATGRDRAEPSQATCTDRTWPSMKPSTWRAAPATADTAIGSRAKKSLAIIKTQGETAFYSAIPPFHVSVNVNSMILVDYCLLGSHVHIFLPFHPSTDE